MNKGFAKRKVIIALLLTAVMAIGTANVLALDYYVPETAGSMTARFFLTDPDDPGDEFSMISEDGGLLIHINETTLIYFEDFVPLSDDCDGMTQMVREVLFGRTLAEVLEGRNLRIIYEYVIDSYPAQTSPISIMVLFETAVHLPIGIGETDLGPAIDEQMDLLFELNGEIVVNNEIIQDAPAPFWHSTDNGDVVMVPLRVVAEALDYEVRWNGEQRSVQLGVAINIWIGRTEVHVGRMAPIELSAAPLIMDSITFVPLDFFRDVLGQTAYVFEGQVVVETDSDMM